LSIPIGAIVEISVEGFTLGDKVEKGIFFLIYHFMALTLPQGRKKDTYQLGRTICNPWNQCCCNKK